MTRTYDQRKQAARERRAAEEAARLEARRRRRRRWLITAIAVLVVAAVAVVLALTLPSALREDHRAAPVVPPAGAVGNGLVIPVGPDSAPVKISVWEDFRCPACNQMETGLGPTFTRYAQEGRVQLLYHLASPVDGQIGGSGSFSAANAAACAQDAGKFAEYHTALFAAQPPQRQDAFASPDRLLSVAGQVQGLVTPTFTSCVRTNAHGGWVTAVQNSWAQAHIPVAMPVVYFGTDPTQATSPTAQIAVSALTADQLPGVLDARIATATASPTPTAPTPTTPTPTASETSATPTGPNPTTPAASAS